MIGEYLSTKNASLKIHEDKEGKTKDRGDASRIGAVEYG